VAQLGAGLRYSLRYLEPVGNGEEQDQSIPFLVFLATANYYNLRWDKELRREVASTRIQAWVRGHIARRHSGADT